MFSVNLYCKILHIFFKVYNRFIIVQRYFDFHGVQNVIVDILAHCQMSVIRTAKVE